MNLNKGVFSEYQCACSFNNELSASIWMVVLYLGDKTLLL